MIGEIGLSASVKVAVTWVLPAVTPLNVGAVVGDPKTAAVDDADQAPSTGVEFGSAAERVQAAT